MRRAAALLAGAVALGGLAVAARAADPDALWKIVGGRCVPHAQAGDPAPCTEVTADWAVLKDINGATQYLLIPTAQITGIESPAVLAPGAPNYFAAAWQARRYVEARAGHPLPADAVALAINPPGARSQNQLHIHVDCVRPDVRDALHGLTVGNRWAMLPTALAGQRYAAKRLPTLEANPFTVLAAELPGAADAMGQYTLAVLGAGDGFVLLAARIGVDGNGHGEDLQDHACALAQAGRRADPQGNSFYLRGIMPWLDHALPLPASMLCCAVDANFARQCARDGVMPRASLGIPFKRSP